VKNLLTNALIEKFHELKKNNITQLDQQTFQQYFDDILQDPYTYNTLNKPVITKNGKHYDQSTVDTYSKNGIFLDLQTEIDKYHICTDQTLDKLLQYFNQAFEEEAQFAHAIEQSKICASQEQKKDLDEEMFHDFSFLDYETEGFHMLTPSALEMKKNAIMRNNLSSQLLYDDHFGNEREGFPMPSPEYYKNAPQTSDYPSFSINTEFDQVYDQSITGDNFPEPPEYPYPYQQSPQFTSDVRLMPSR